MHKLYFLSLLLLSFISHAQVHLLKEIPLSDQVNSAELIAEGEVIAKKSYWDSNKHNIYTVHTLDISKLYKGASTAQINIVTSGGIVGLDAQVDYPSLELNKSEKGIFILEKFDLNLAGHKSSLPLYQVTGTSQGLFRYNTQEKKIYNPFTQVASPADLEQKITSLTNKQPRQLKAVDYFESKKKKTPFLQTANVVAASISSISPTNIGAGDKSVLTINGSGFGTTKGIVRFKNADTAGSTTIDALETQITSWTDTKIQVEVPGKAGSGDIEVETSTGTKSQISGLIIPYAIGSLQYADPQSTTNVQNGKKVEYRMHHVGSDHNATSTESNFDGNGSYLFKYHTNFAAAKTAFESAFNDMVCNGGANLKISTQTTTAKDVVDNINSIHFGTPGGSKVAKVTKRLATGYVFDANTWTYDMYWFIYEMDYVFDETLSWSYDSSTTSATEYDLNTIARHETGHASGLGHVNDAKKLMDAYTSRGPKNISSTSAHSPITTKITYDKATTPVYSLTKADFSDCYKQNLGIDTIEQSAFQLYPNPASGLITISGQHTIEAVAVYNITGALVHEASVADGIGSSEVSIGLGNFTSGIYFTKVSDATGSQSLRFVKE